LSNDTTKTTNDLAEQTEIIEEIFKANFLEDYRVLDTKTKLYATYDDDYIREDTSWYAEGTVMLKTSVLTNIKNDQTINFVWDEDGESLYSIEAFYEIYNDDYEVEKEQYVASKDGLYLGMPFNELRDWAVEDFSFSGFDWDYGGGIFIEEGSKFQQTDVRINLSYTLSSENYETVSNVIGDIEIESSSTEANAVPIFVNSLTLFVQ